MYVELDKKDLIALVKGTAPNYKVMEYMNNIGRYLGGMNDRWVWDDSKLGNLSEKTLYKVYTICKNSWKDK